MKEKFIQFLKDNGALEKFEAAIADDDVRFGDTYSTTIEKWMDECDNPMNYLDCAFAWSKSVDGHEYWYDVDNKWMTML